MTKSQIIDALAEGLKIQKKEAERFLEGFTDLLADSLKKGDKTNLAGLGVFSVKDCPPRTARNPKTGASIAVPATKKVRFKVSSVLSEVVAATMVKPVA